MMSFVRNSFLLSRYKSHGFHTRLFLMCDYMESMRFLLYVLRNCHVVISVIHVGKSQVRTNAAWLYCYANIRNHRTSEILCLIPQTRRSVDHVSLSRLHSRHRGSSCIRVCGQGSHPQGPPVRVRRWPDRHQAGTWMEHFQVSTHPAPCLLVLES